MGGLGARTEIASAPRQPWASEEGAFHNSRAPGQELGEENAGLGFLEEAGVFLTLYSPACLSCALASRAVDKGLDYCSLKKEAFPAWSPGQAWELAKRWGLSMGAGAGADVRTHFPIVSSQTQMVIGQFIPDGGWESVPGRAKNPPGLEPGLESSFPDQEYFLSTFPEPVAGGRKEGVKSPTHMALYLP